MLHKLLLVECVKMSCESLSHDRVNNWLGSSRATVQLEGLIGLLICSLKFEFLWLIVRYSIKAY
jgi:hypothetical protein